MKKKFWIFIGGLTGFGCLSLVCVFLLGVDRIGQYTGMHKDWATSNAITYSKETGIEKNVIGVSCTNQDSDPQDGYISCTLAFAPTEKECTETLDLECAGFNITGLTGCKKKIKIEHVGRARLW